MNKVVIIGGVAGGATAAARLRRLDEKIEIILLERGEYISYANCGLPYHVSDVIRDRESLLVQTPEKMKSKYNIDVRVKNEVIKINRNEKTVTVRKADSGEVYDESYDKLIISTGSSPIRPPIPGIDSERIRTLWTVPDTDRIRDIVQNGGIKTAAVIGGGFIGLEMAENLHTAGLTVSVVEMQDQVMAPMDFEMAQLIHKNLIDNDVNLILGDGVERFNDDGERVNIALKSGKTISAELVILSIGVRANSELARAAGLEVNPRGGIIVDDKLLTSDPDIYAVGDVIEVKDFTFNEPAMIPLAGPANKQGRIVANNLFGAQESYRGTQGTSIAKVFDLAAASTGVNEKTLIKRGLKKGEDYESIIITQNSHASYYPGATPLTLKLLFSADGNKIFGAQIIGAEGVDKRIDVLSTAIRLGAGVSELKELELAYAPPFSSAKDPVNMAGYVAENILKGQVRFSSEDLNNHPDAVLLDIRETHEVADNALPGATNIPLGQLRDRLDELDKASPTIVMCAIGVRSYNASRILRENGFKNVLIYPAGTNFYQSLC